MAGKMGRHMGLPLRIVQGRKSADYLLTILQSRQVDQGKQRYTTPAGVIIHGHWKYVGPPQRHRIWIPGHWRAR